jgi:hypothetical protein
VPLILLLLCAGGAKSVRSFGQMSRPAESKSVDFIDGFVWHAF